MTDPCTIITKTENDHHVLLREEYKAIFPLIAAWNLSPFSHDYSTLCVFMSHTNPFNKLIIISLTDVVHQKRIPKSMKNNFHDYICSTPYLPTIHV